MITREAAYKRAMEKKRQAQKEKKQRYNMRVILILLTRYVYI